MSFSVVPIGCILLAIYTKMVGLKLFGNDTKVVLNVGTNLILTDQWRVYIDAERSFGGSRNVDYQANIGARFSFGDKISSLPKPSKPLPLKTSENKNNK